MTDTTIAALRAENEKLREAGITMSRAADRHFESARQLHALRAEVERLESELADALTDLNTARQENASFGPEFKRLTAEVERLRVALWDIHAVCNNWDWFIWMWPIRRIKRIARAALEGKP